MPKTKGISFDLRKGIVNAHRGGDGYTKFSLHFQVSSTGVRSIIRKFKDSHTVKKKPGKRKKLKISKTLERKLVRDPRTTAKSES